MMLVSRRGRAIAALLTATALAAPLAVSPTFFVNPAEARQGFESYADLVEASKPAVVTVMVKTVAQGASGAPGMPQLDPNDPMQDFMRKFFGERGETPTPQPPRQAEGLGSGFIIDADGLIVTNNHVIDNASEVTVRLEDGTELPATVLGADDKTDIAVLKVDAGRSLPTVPWGDSDAIRVGDPVVAIGNPFGLGGTVTSGIVSARGRDIHSGPYDDFLQVDAAINRGNSGGPLFDADGQVVGVNSAIFSPTGGNIGLGFAIPANQARDIVAEIVENGHVERGLISVTIQPVTPEIAEGLGLSDARGALVASVGADGPAAKAGVKPGDVILGFGGAQVDELRDLTRAVAETTPGETAGIEVWRNGEVITLETTVGRMPTTMAAATTPAQPSADAVASLGLTLQSPAGVEGALVASVDPSGPAAAALRPGDLIVAVGQVTVTNAEQAKAQIAAAEAAGRKSVALLVEREEAQRFVSVPLGQS